MVAGQNLRDDGRRPKTPRGKRYFPKGPKKIGNILRCSERPRDTLSQNITNGALKTTEHPETSRDAWRHRWCLAAVQAALLGAGNCWGESFWGELGRGPTDSEP